MSFCILSGGQKEFLLRQSIASISVLPQFSVGFYKLESNAYNHILKIEDTHFYIMQSLDHLNKIVIMQEDAEINL